MICTLIHQHLERHADYNGYKEEVAVVNVVGCRARSHLAGLFFAIDQLMPLTRTRGCLVEFSIDQFPSFILLIQSPIMGRCRFWNIPRKIG